MVEIKQKEEKYRMNIRKTASQRYKTRKQKGETRQQKSSAAEIIEALFSLTKGLGMMAWMAILAVTIMFVGGMAWLRYINSSNGIGFKTNRKIDITPAQIESIRRIGQWEFLSISDEELIDTVDRGFIKDRELSRIYYGTLRLGVDLGKTGKQWLTKRDTIVIATLPPIELLDSNFVDEARTRSFFESGKWSDSDREQLYNRAKRKMLSRCMTKDNISKAQENAREQFTQLLNAMGFNRVEVTFQNNK